FHVTGVQTCALPISGLCRATACGLGAAPDYRGRSGDAVHQCDAAIVFPARLQDTAGDWVGALDGWVDCRGGGVPIHGGRYAVSQAGVVEFVGGELGGGVFEFGGVDGAVGVAVEVAFASGEVCACPFAPGAVLLQMKLAPPRTVGAPASGANVCRTGSHRAVRRSGGAPTDKPAHLVL